MPDLGDEVSEQTEESLRALEKKMDSIGAKLDLLSQKLDLYDVEKIRNNQQDMRQSIASIETAIKAGGAVALLVLGAVVALVFQVFVG